MSKVVLSADIAKKTGRKIRPLHGLNSGPMAKVFTYDSTKQYKDLKIPYCRLHDVEYPYGSGEFVDVPCIFKNFDADETKEENYSFALTDEYLKPIFAVGSEPLFRLGVSIEHPCAEFGISAHVDPPKDFEKWARICEHIIRHYTEGWADGFTYSIEYWEIWNEADGGRNHEIGHKNQWNGTPEQFAEFYATAARHLKKCFPHLKIGGPAFTSAQNEWVDEFFACLDKINSEGEKVPMDFYSWHRYCPTTDKILDHAKKARALLNAHGYENAENILDEWNYMVSWDDQAESYVALKDHRGAAYCAAVLSMLQSDTDVSLSTYFEGDPVKEWCGIMECNTMRIGLSKACQRELKPYSAFKAFSQLYELGNEIETSVSDPELHVTGAEKDGLWGILLGNDRDIAKNLKIDLKGANLAGARILMTDADTDFEPVYEEIPKMLTLPAHSFIFITNLYSAEIKADFGEKTRGRIRPMHGVNQGPMTKVFTYDARPQFKELGIPYCRLHDTEYPYGSGEFVDIPNIFKNFDADEKDPANYDFRLTDVYMEKVYEAGSEPFFRLGVSIEHATKLAVSARDKSDFYLKLASRIHPPKDYEKWARICEQIIRHYTEGWAEGYHWKLDYWEIYNEPEGSSMWTGTPEQFYELYCVTARHLKKCFPHLKIGGCGFTRATNSFITGFFKYLDKENEKGERVPLDFFSWHRYYQFAETMLEHAKIARKQLNEHGYPDAESILNEWNYSEYEESLTGERFVVIKDYRGAAHAAATLAAMQQETDITVGCMFEADVTKEWCGLFDVAKMHIGAHGHKATVKPLPPFYAFKAFNELYKIGDSVELKVSNPFIHAAAAEKDGKFGVLIGNDKKKSYKISLNLQNLQTKGLKVYLTDEEHNFEVVATKLQKEIIMRPRSFVFITNTL